MEAPPGAPIVHSRERPRSRPDGRLVEPGVIGRFVVIVGISCALVVGVAVSPAHASGSTLASTLASWTQPDLTSYNLWNAARLNRAGWKATGFDWSTDFCTDSPDQPLGFDFRVPCWRHDFGYRNYRALGTFDANRSRLDTALYVDLLAKCLKYNAFVRPACNALAYTYYQAVLGFGGFGDQWARRAPV